MQSAAVTAIDDDSLFRNHDRLIRRLASRFTSSGVSLDDLVQEGRIALWHASKTWLRKNDASLWTYARRAVFAAMLRCSSAHLAETHAQLEEDDAVERDDLEVALLVRECLALLDADEQQVIGLFMAGESIRAIAVVMNRSKSDVDRLFQRAVATLRERVS